MPFVRHAHPGTAHRCRLPRHDGWSEGELKIAHRYADIVRRHQLTLNSASLMAANELKPRTLDGIRNRLRKLIKTQRVGSDGASPDNGQPRL